MEKKNMVLLTVIAVATLLVAVVGATFAFFASSVQDDRSDENGGTGNTNVNTAKLASSTSVVANIDGAAGSFTAENVYPGHKEVAALQVTAKGDATDAVVPFIYEVRDNTISSNGGTVKVTLYKSGSAVKTDKDNSMGCKLDVDTTTQPGQTRYSESCSVEESTFGTKVGSTITLKGGQENISLGIDTIKLAAGESEKTAYYYVVVEYENDPANDQSETQTGKVLDGIIRVA